MNAATLLDLELSTSQLAEAAYYLAFGIPLARIGCRAMFDADGRLEGVWCAFTFRRSSRLAERVAEYFCGTPLVDLHAYQSARRQLRERMVMVQAAYRRAWRRGRLTGGAGC